MAAFFSKLWEYLSRLGIRFFGPMSVLVAMYFGLLDFIAAEMAVFLSAVLNYTIPGVDFALADTYVPIARINRFIPLREFMLCFVGYYALAVVFVVHRLIKSYIPTMGN